MEGARRAFNTVVGRGRSVTQFSCHSDLRKKVARFVLVKLFPPNVISGVNQAIKFARYFMYFIFKGSNVQHDLSAVTNP